MRRTLAAALLLLALQASEAFGQAPSSPPQPQASARLPVPPAENLVLLIRLSLLTLNDAMQTGNYTVLRDRAGPSFQHSNTAASLARTFAKLEAQGIDLGAVAIMTPQLSAAEVVGTEQRLHVGGHFGADGARMNFDLTFEPADGHWRLFGVSVGPAPAAPPQPVAEAVPAAKSAAAKSPEKPKSPAKK